MSEPKARAAGSGTRSPAPVDTTEAEELEVATAQAQPLRHGQVRRTLLLTVIPITAGGAGVVELGYIGLLAGYAGAANINQVTAGVMLFRLATWVAIIPIGWLTVLVWRLSVRRGTAGLDGAREVSEAVAAP